MVCAVCVADGGVGAVLRRDSVVGRREMARQFLQMRGPQQPSALADMESRQRVEFPSARLLRGD